MLSVNVLFEHDSQGNPHGCSYIRLLLPLSHPSIDGKIHLISSTTLAPEKTDIVIVERWWKPGLTINEATDLVNEIRRRRSIFIYTLDDNLLDISDDEDGVPVSENLNLASRYFVRAADAIIVSTVALRDRLLPLNENVYVIDNALDERKFAHTAGNSALDSGASDKRSSTLLTIGYMGTLTHASDLQMIIEPLRRIGNTFGNMVKFQFIGVTDNQRVLQSLTGCNVEVLNPGAAVHYEQFVKWFSNVARWDIGLTPLANRKFNEFKSDIKLLDYGIAGIPAVFSNFGPYPKSVVHMQNGVLAENHPDSWFDALSKLVTDGEVRKAISTNVKAYVDKHRTLRSRAVGWYDCLMEVHRKRQ